MNRLQNILEKIFEIPGNTITDDLSPETVPAWDSFNGLLLVSELEREFGVTFTMQEVVNVKNVGDIKKALSSHGVEDV